MTSTSTIPFYLLIFLMILSYQIAEAEEQTAGGLLLTQATKEKPSVGTVSILIYHILCSIYNNLSNILLIMNGYIQDMNILAVQQTYHFKEFFCSGPSLNFGGERH